MWWQLISGAALLGVIGIAAWQYRSNTAQYRPLASRQPQMDRTQETELGMEAIDMAEISRTQRSNESLERSSNLWSRRSGADLGTTSMPDDETYARRFHAAFMKNKD